MFTLLYVDDACVLLEGENLNDLIIMLKVELASLSVWLKSNKISLILLSADILFLPIH